MLIPKNRHEYYLAVISGNDYPTFPPKIREEQYLAKLAGREVDVPTPRTPKERAYYNIINDIKFEPENRWQIFVAAANDDSITAPIPRTREEIWWSNISLSHEVIVEYVGTLPAILTGTKAGYLESYKIYGNAVQDGTPTPDNPIVPSGCGERTVNLWNFQPSAERSGVTLTWNGAKIVFSGICTLSSNLTKSITLSAGTYTIKANANRIPVEDDNSCVDVYKASPYMMAKITNRNAINGIANFTLGEETTVILRIRVQADVNYDGFTLEPMLNSGSTALPYEPYGYKLPLTVNGVEYPIYIGDAQLAKDEYVDSTTGKVYRRTENLSPPEEEWIDGQIGGGDGTVHPSTQIKVSPFIDVSTCETCIMEVFSAETEWAAAGYREMAFYDENKQYLGWIGGGGRQTLTPDSTEMLSEFPAGTVYVRIGCSHGDQPFYPQLVSGYTPTHQFYPYLVPTDPPTPFPQLPTVAGTTVIDYNGETKPDKVELTYKTIKKSYISADDKVYQDPNGQLLGG